MDTFQNSMLCFNLACFTYFENSKFEATSLPLTKWLEWFCLFWAEKFPGIDSLNWNFQLGNFSMRKNTLSWDTRFAHLTPLLLLNLWDHRSISSAKNLAKLSWFWGSLQYNAILQTEKWRIRFFHTSYSLYIRQNFINYIDFKFFLVRLVFKIFFHYEP